MIALVVNLFTAGSYFKSFVILNEFASSCHTSLANFSVSHTKKPEWLSLVVMKTTWISWNTFKWHFCGISWTHSGWQPGSLGQPADTQDKCSTDFFFSQCPGKECSTQCPWKCEEGWAWGTLLPCTLCVTMGKPACHTLCVTLGKPVYQDVLSRWCYFSNLCGNTLRNDGGMFGWGS